MSKSGKKNKQTWKLDPKYPLQDWRPKSNQNYMRMTNGPSMHSKVQNLSYQDEHKAYQNKIGREHQRDILKKIPMSRVNELQDEIEQKNKFMHQFTAEDFAQFEKEKNNGKGGFTIFDKKRVNDEVGMGQLYNTQRRESYKCKTVKMGGQLTRPIDDYNEVIPNFKRFLNQDAKDGYYQKEQEKQMEEKVRNKTMEKPPRKKELQYNVKDTLTKPKIHKLKIREPVDKKEYVKYDNLQMHRKRPQMGDYDTEKAYRLTQKRGYENQKDWRPEQEVEPDDEEEEKPEKFEPFSGQAPRKLEGVGHRIAVEDKGDPYKACRIPDVGHYKNVEKGYGLLGTGAKSLKKKRQ